MSPWFDTLLTRAERSSEVVLALAAVAIVAALIVPLPGWLLDVGIALNLTAGVTLLVAALYAADALQVAAFPTLLLLTTLFRLAMNVSSTRLALADGHAGSIIAAFGEFVVRGDYVVGGVIFLILTLVQFLVVAKGAERVAEVGARFSLDAMPGKQMSIDADLRAGAIDQAEARKRRRALERESQLYGAMDGAMKFIKGDVIAGLTIVVVVLVGGVLNGLVRGMDALEALETYALLAIGDGLVSQIPSLCVAVAAGLVVTRVSAEEEHAGLGREIGRQFFGTPRALYVVSGLCGMLALMPGMPRLTFVALGLCLAGCAYGISQRAGGRSPTGEASEQTAKGEGTCLTLSLERPRLSLDLSSDLGVLAEADENGLARRDLMALRERLFHKLGVVVPPIHVRLQAENLGRRSYAVLLDDVPVAGGYLDPEGRLALASEHELAGLGVQGLGTTEPGSGVPAVWLSSEAASMLRSAGIHSLTPREVLGRHLERVLTLRAASLLGVQETQALIDAFEQHAPALVKEVLVKVSLPLLTDVLRRLLEEQVSLRNLRAVLEALASPTAEGDASALVERCRQALRRDISHRYAPHGSLFAYLTDPTLEQALRGAAEGALAPERVNAIVDAARRVSEGSAEEVVVLSSPDVRSILRRLCEPACPNLAVLTYGELEPHLQVRPLGSLGVA